MSVALSQALATARLDAVLAFLATGAGRARVRIFAGSRPPSADAAPGAGADILVELELDDPPGVVASGALTLDPLADGLIMATGQAAWARVLNGAGAAAFDCDVSDTAGSAPLKLDTTQLYAGGAVRLVSAVLT